jgi:nucleoside-diphosphate-sugar epimerase
MGVPVRIGSVAKHTDAERLLGDADIVVNFALAMGTGREVRALHDTLIRNSFLYSPVRAKMIFFSTLSVNNSFGPDGRGGGGAYGREKLRNEKLVRRIARDTSRDALVLRLGHVCGELQPITSMARALIANSTLHIPDPDRHANCVATATIVDAIIGVEEGRVPAAGRFDLVNHPRWTWRDVLEYEAARLGRPLRLAAAPERPALAGLSRAAVSASRAVFASAAIKERADTLMLLLPASAGETIKMHYLRHRAACEIAQLHQRQVQTLDAAHFPAWNTQVPEGLRATATLLAVESYITPAAPIGMSWPKDL